MQRVCHGFPLHSSPAKDPTYSLQSSNSGQWLLKCRTFLWPADQPWQGPPQEELRSARSVGTVVAIVENPSPHLVTVSGAATIFVLTGTEF